MIEIVDTTSEEMYFTLAVYSDYETALAELKKRDKADCDLTDSGDYEDYETVEIREHFAGWGKGYKTLLILERTKNYHEDTDGYLWKSEYRERSKT
jgi:hypothetical protein